MLLYSLPSNFKHFQCARKATSLKRLTQHKMQEQAWRHGRGHRWRNACNYAAIQPSQRFRKFSVCNRIELKGKKSSVIFFIQSDHYECEGFTKKILMVKVQTQQKKHTIAWRSEKQGQNQVMFKACGVSTVDAPHIYITTRMFSSV